MFERLANQWADLFLLGVVAIIAGLMESILVTEKRNPRYWLILFTVSMPIAILCGGIAKESGVSDFWTLTITACSSILARDGLHAFLMNKGEVLKFIWERAKALITTRTGG